MLARSRRSRNWCDEPPRLELVFDEPRPVLGIDPGLSRCGYGAIVRESSARVRAVCCGVLRTDPELELPQRLAILADDLESLLRDVQPVVVVVERVLFQVNARTAISVGQASGLALMTAARHGIPVIQYSPNEVKLAIAGDGGAGKDEVAAMVVRMLKLQTTPKPADATDALALALCHAWRARVPAASARELDASIARNANGVAMNAGVSTNRRLEQRIAAAVSKGRTS